MLTAMIGDWRALWNDKELPFLLVKLPGWENWLDSPGNLDYMTIRKCQEMVARKVDHAWLCSISDAGERMDIHPKNKKVVRGGKVEALHVYRAQDEEEKATSSGITGEAEQQEEIPFTAQILLWKHCK